MTASISRRFGAALAIAGLGFAFAATPVSLQIADGSLAVKASQAFAKHGADDPAGHDRNDDRGGNRGGGKKGGGRDDGPNHQ